MCTLTDISGFTNFDIYSTCKSILVKLEPINISKNESFSWLSFSIDGLKKDMYWDIEAFYTNYKTNTNYRIDLIFEGPMAPDYSTPTQGPKYEIELYMNTTYPDTNNSSYKVIPISGSDRFTFATCPIKGITNVKPYSVKCNIKCMDVTKKNNITKYTLVANVSFFGHHK